VAKHSRRYRSAAGLIERSRRYPITEAIDLLKETATAKFDETIEVSMRLGVDPKKSDQMIRGSVCLPHGIGRSLRVIAFVEGEAAEAAEEAGAIEVGGADLVEKIQGGWTEFDVAVAAPAMMRHVGKLGRILGPQGKMPSPRSGTVTDNVAQAVSEFAAGKIEYRLDSGANVHVPVGKKSFENEKLVENIEFFIEHIQAAKPAASKGTFVLNVAVAPTMGPGIRLAIG
jgi:large subunit ribosomal protein L1